MAKEYTLDEARAAKTKAMDVLAGLPVVGVGITRNEAGFCLKVNLSEACDNIPCDVDGVPILAEVVGKIRKQ